jgi:carbon-monoxide dehydrogenase medium subunit
VIQSAAGRRTVDLRDFHLGPYETAVGDTEILVELRIPIRPGAGSAYEKVERRAGDWSIAAAAAFVEMDGATIGDVGIGLTAVGLRQFACPEAEDLLRGGPGDAPAVAVAAELCAATCNPPVDQRGPEDYKRHLVGVLVGRALTRSIVQAQEGTI